MPLQANAQGRVSGKFTIPRNLPAGNKRVEFVGAQGSRGEAIFSGQGEILRRQMQQITTITTRRTDPLAQTFMLNQSCQIAALELWFSARGTSPVIVQIRETSVGFPNQTILGEARIQSSALNLGGNVTCIHFNTPVSLSASTEYAMVVMCNDASTALAIAELGKWDNFVGRWVTSQPYQVGVLLSSSNASSWTVHQDRDMAFRLLKAQFSATQQNVDLGTCTVSAATDVMLLAYAERPQVAASVEYEFRLPDGQFIKVSDGQAVRLANAVSGAIGVTAKLAGTSNASPILYPGTQLVAGQVATSADYISRAIPAGNNSRVRIIFDANIPGGAGVAVALKGIDASDTWQNVAYVLNKPLDDGWQEMVYESTGVNESAVQIRLRLSGASSARPRVKNLRVIIV